jgi:hypothetical protein
MPDGVIQIVDQLPHPSQLAPNEEVIFRFSGTFLYLTGLVLLAAWRKSLPGSVVVSIDDASSRPEAQRFLTNTGFREVIETRTYHPSVPSRIGKVPIQALLKGREKEATVNEIVKIFDDYAGQVTDTAPFRVLLSELCENALSHSELTTPAYICARVLEGINKCEIAITDTGICIEQSFQRGTNEGALKKIALGESALGIALEGLSSSKPQTAPGIFRTYYGFGLYIARRLVEENHGRLCFMSGNEMITVERFARKSRRLANPWQGTFVGTVIDLDYPLPLENVYAEAAGMVVPALKTKYGQPLAPLPVTAPPKPESTVPLALSNYGTQLLTRELGTAIRADLASHLAAGRTVLVRLDGIEDITPSCVDDAFGKLSEMMGSEAFASRVKFEGGQPVVKTLIQFVLKTRQRQLG